jgi:hypothetical protein
VTVIEIDAAVNEAVRRDLIEAYPEGLAGYLRSSGTVSIQSDETGALVRRELVGEPIVAIVVKCPSTGRNYVLRVPPTVQTAREAVAWTFGLKPDEYLPTAQS